MIYDISTLMVVKFFNIIKTDNKYILLKNNFRFNWLNKIQVKLFRIDLEKQWSSILEKYNEGENSLRIKKIESLRKKYEKLNTKYKAIIVALEVLKYGSDDEMLDILKEYGYEIDGEYEDGLLLIYKQTENLKNKIDAIRDELDGYLKVNDEDDKDTDIYEITINILIGLGLSLKINDITVLEFIYYKKSLEKKIKQQNKK